MEDDRYIYDAAGVPIMEKCWWVPGVYCDITGNCCRDMEVTHTPMSCCYLEPADEPF